jgi:hypothetical protein
VSARSKPFVAGLEKCRQKIVPNRLQHFDRQNFVVASGDFLTSASLFLDFQISSGKKIRPIIHQLDLNLVKERLFGDQCASPPKLI